jgi:hypothetical protein
VRVAARDLGVARLARRGRMAQQVCDVILMNIRRPEPRGKGVPEIAPLVIAHVGETYSHMFPTLMVLEVVFMPNVWVVFFTTLMMTQILK